MIAGSWDRIGDCYAWLVREVEEKGQRVVPRRKPNREVRPVLIKTDRWGCLKGSGVDYRFATAEGMAWLCGWDDVAWLKAFRPSIDRFSDDGKIFHGAYGKRLGFQGGSLGKALQVLQADQDSRQVVANIWSNVFDLGETSKDLPCNTQLLLKVRPQAQHTAQTPHPALHLTVVVRSQDLVWGFPYDHHGWWLVLHTLASCLDVDPGCLTQVIDSLHVYEPEAGFYTADKVTRARGAGHATLPVVWPTFKSLAQVRRYLTAARNWVICPAEADHDMALEVQCPELVDEQALHEQLIELVEWLDGTRLDGTTTGKNIGYLPVPDLEGA